MLHEKSLSWSGKSLCFHHCANVALTTVSYRLYADRIYRVAQKLAPFLYALALPNISRFSKLFHCQNLEKICSHTVIKDPHRGLPPWRGGGAYAPMTRTIF